MNSEQDIFKQINNAVLDLQAAQLQTYPRPLKKLGRLLQAPELQPFNERLSAGVDLDAFIAAGENTQGSMIGSAHLDWPDDEHKVLGLQLLLVQRFAETPDFMAEFGHQFYDGSSRIMAGVSAVTGQLIIPFARDYKSFVLSQGDTKPKLIVPITNKVFVVHGHDGEARETVARFLEKIGFDPIILHEQANRGRTIIEKVEANGDVGFAVVLLTPDDLGKPKGASDLEPRARQNVLLELGYFIARLGRDKVCALKKGHVEIPSDFAGVVWEAMDDGGGWRQKLARELNAAGHVIDWNKVMA